MEESPSNFVLRLIQCPLQKISKSVPLAQQSFGPNIKSAKPDSLCCLTLPQKISKQYHFFVNAVDDTIKVGKICK
jgi:hypothetical protein